MTRIPHLRLALATKWSASTDMSSRRSRNGGHVERDHVEAVIQVVAKSARLDRLRQASVGGGNQADVQLDRLGAAQPLEFAFLQDAQQFGLQAGREFADLVQKQRSAFGHFNFAFFLRGGAGEGALFVAEQFALQQGFGNGGAVDGDEGLFGARAVAMQGIGPPALFPSRSRPGSGRWNLWARPGE